jgi:hypothetical protein
VHTSSELHAVSATPTPPTNGARTQTA